MTTTTTPVNYVQPSTPASSARPGKVAWVIGWVLSGLLILMFGAGGIYAIVDPSMMNDGLKQQGFPPSAGKVLIAIEIGCALIFAIPRTAVLGAILFTGFFGGAICVHLRLGDGLWFVPLAFGIVVWLAMYLRDPRVRELVPLRTPFPPRRAAV